MIVEFPTRAELLAACIERRGVGAEIGVLRGQHAAELLGTLDPFVLHLVDPWQSDDRDPAWRDAAGDVESLLGWHRAVRLHRSTGSAWLREQAEASLDWVYLDGSHEFGETCDEIDQACRVVRRGGIIAGHDLIVEAHAYWGSGVVRAVIDACQRGRLRMIGVSRETFASWACINGG